MPRPKDESGLTDKQQRFCELYVGEAKLNGSEAARMAGYSENSAGAIASENLQKPEIQARIAELRATLSERTSISAEKVLREVALVAFSDHSEYEVDASGKLTLREGAPPEAIRAVGKLRFKRRVGDDYEETETEVGLWDKVAALRSLMKHLGIDGAKDEDLHDMLVGFNLAEARRKLAERLAKKGDESE